MFDSIQIRSARSSDVSHLLDIEEYCWKLHLRASEETIVSRISRNPEGCFVAIQSCKIVGVLYTQNINGRESLEKVRFSNQESLHTNVKEGLTLQLMAIAVDTRNSTGNVGDDLREAAIAYAQKNNLKEIVAMTRCNRFFNHLYETESYVNVLENDDLERLYGSYVMTGRDPTLFFHLSGKAAIQKVIEKYRIEDVDNLGHAIMICYEIQPVKEVQIDSELVKGLAQKISDVLREWNILEPNLGDIKNTPLLTIIDSIDLMQLHTWLEGFENTPTSYVPL